MFSDTLVRLEQANLLALAIWGAAGVLAGTGLLALVTVTRARSALLAGFGVNTAVWGLAELAGAAWRSRDLAPVDLAGATQLDRLLWFGAGLEIGAAAVGVVLIVAGWRLGRRWGLVGAGLAVVVQAGALFALDVRLLTLLAAAR